MKWLKLDCDFRNDPKVLALARKWGGLEAAGFWTLLLSFVGGHMDGTSCKVPIATDTQFDEKYLADWFSSKPQVIISRVSAAAQLGLIHGPAWEQDREIFIPNMLKRLDDYTRKVRTLSGLSPEQVRHQKKEERSREVRKKTNTSAAADGAPVYPADFEAFWSQSTKRGSKVEALRVWEQLRPTSELASTINAAMQAWKQSDQWQDETKQPHIVRWLRRRGWEEQVPKRLFGNGRDFKAGPQLLQVFDRG